jgi:hypothetical protein
VCEQTDEKDFKKKLEKRTNDKGKEFLLGLMGDKEKWAPTHDKGGKRCGYMTSNRTEIFNSLLIGVRSLHVIAIAPFTFYKCNKSIWIFSYQRFVISIWITW